MNELDSVIFRIVNSKAEAGRRTLICLQAGGEPDTTEAMLSAPCKGRLPEAAA